MMKEDLKSGVSRGSDTRGVLRMGNGRFFRRKKMNTNSAIYTNYPNGQFFDTTWADKDGNTVIFFTGTATLNGNIWGDYNNKVLTSKETPNDSITIYDNGAAIYQFSLSAGTSTPYLTLPNNTPNAFYKVISKVPPGASAQANAIP